MLLICGLDCSSYLWQRDGFAEGAPDHATAPRSSHTPRLRSTVALERRYWRHLLLLIGSDNLIRFLREIPRIARGETLANDRHKQPDLGVSKGVLQLAGPPPCVGIEKGLVDSWIDFADLLSSSQKDTVGLTTK